MKNKLIICDIDNTLLFTDKLNSESYIEAAKNLNIHLPDSVTNKPRITLSLIEEYVKDIDKNTLNVLQEEKLKYFLGHLEKIEVNNELLDIINDKNTYLCLWTASNRRRAFAECKTLNIPFDDLISFNKDNVNLEALRKILLIIISKYKVNNTNVIVYDDDRSFLQKIKELGYKTELVRDQ